MQRQPVDAQGLFLLQADLRDRLLRRGRLSSEERGLAAEMLLYLDDLPGCWAVCADWLLARTAADRVDAGFATAADPVYVPRLERRQRDGELPSVLGARFDARQEAIRAVWAAPRAVVYQDAANEPRIQGEVRSLLLAAQTRSKIAVAIRDRGRDLGLLCMDSGRAFRLGRPGLRGDGPGGARSDGARPLGCTGARARQDQVPAAPAAPARLPGLTVAETRVAQLVLAGCSYKEIARKLDRSCSTIDHQLRSIRAKLGVNSTAKLVRELNLHAARLQAA
jgi:DNA-binding CsgD family transcriptional regulator